VPCKHIAAVLYLTSARIDANPFVAFEIHNYDLKATVKKMAGTATGDAGGGGSSSSGSSSGKGKDGKDGSGNVLGNVLDVAIFEELVTKATDTEITTNFSNFSKPLDLSQLAASTNDNRIIQLYENILKPTPLFFKRGDFRELFLGIVKGWRKENSGTVGVAPKAKAKSKGGAKAKAKRGRKGNFQSG
jgi:hypothetical protein